MMPWVCDAVALHKRLAAKIPHDHVSDPPSVVSPGEHTSLGERTKLAGTFFYASHKPQRPTCRVYGHKFDASTRDKILAAIERPASRQTNGS